MVLLGAALGPALVKLTANDLIGFHCQNQSVRSEQLKLRPSFHLVTSSGFSFTLRCVSPNAV